MWTNMYQSFFMARLVLSVLLGGFLILLSGVALGQQEENAEYRRIFGPRSRWE